MGFHVNRQMKKISILTTTIRKETWTKTLNTAVMECYFLSRPVDEEVKPVKGYRRRMHSTWKDNMAQK